MIKINEFKSALEKYDALRPNLFQVTFGMPQCLQNGTANSITDKGKLLTLYCRSASIPAQSLMLADVRRYGIGPNVKMPYHGAHEDVSLTFINDASSRVFYFFQSWMDYIYPMASREGKYLPGEGPSYNLRFKNSYVTDVEIATYGADRGTTAGLGLAQTLTSVVSTAVGAPFIGALINSELLGPMDQTLKKTSETVLYNAFPTSIGSLQFTSDSGNSFSEFTVNFTYLNQETGIYLV